MEYTDAAYWGSLMSAGLCRLAVLRVVCAEPAHGYTIRRRVAACTGQLCTPTEGAIYPILRDLERAGCLRNRTEARGRRIRIVYEATTRGRQAAKVGRDVWRLALPRLMRLFESRPQKKRPGSIAT